jgi:hypothetical protein
MAYFVHIKDEMSQGVVDLDSLPEPLGTDSGNYIEAHCRADTPRYDLVAVRKEVLETVCLIIDVKFIRDEEANLECGRRLVRLIPTYDQEHQMTKL